ncbi:MAG: hypothetical protein ABSE06_21710 [Anaerolineaceae bacterium]|jgi:hypothetical protein
MLKKRLFYVLLVLGLVGLVWISTNPSLLTPKVVFAAAPSSQQENLPNGYFCPFTTEELLSLHTVFNKDINVSMLETSDGPIGYDGGSFALAQCRISK